MGPWGGSAGASVSRRHPYRDWVRVFHNILRASECLHPLAQVGSHSTPRWGHPHRFWCYPKASVLPSGEQASSSTLCQNSGFKRVRPGWKTVQEMALDPRLRQVQFWLL